MLSPDYLQDALQPLPDAPWRAILIDPPYTVDDAAHYAPGTFPSANALLKNALMAVEPGGRVGMLHYVWPQPPKSISCKSVAAVGVIVGFNNRIRIFSVFERGAS